MTQKELATKLDAMAAKCWRPDSSITVSHNGEVSFLAKCENLWVTPLNMMEKWHNNGGRQWIKEKLSELREKVKIIDLRTLESFHFFTTTFLSQ